jgi:hypothetical protein
MPGGYGAARDWNRSTFSGASGVLLGEPRRLRPINSTKEARKGSFPELLGPFFFELMMMLCGEVGWFSVQGAQKQVGAGSNLDQGFCKQDNIFQQKYASEHSGPSTQLCSSSSDR